MAPVQMFIMRSATLSRRRNGNGAGKSRWIITRTRGPRCLTVPDKKLSWPNTLAIACAVFLVIWLPGFIYLPMPLEVAAASLLLAGGLIALSVVDLQSFRLPDALTLPLAGSGLILAFILGWEPSLGWRVLAAVAGYAFVWTIGAAYQAWRGFAGIGLGDAKLMAVAGAWLGFEGLPATLLYACMSALCFIGLSAMAGTPFGRHDALPFGPFIAIGIWLVWLYGPLA